MKNRPKIGLPPLCKIKIIEKNFYFWDYEINTFPCGKRKHVWSEKTNSDCHSALPAPLLTENCQHYFSARKIKSRTFLWFGLKLCMQFLEFWNLKNPKTRIWSKVNPAIRLGIKSVLKVKNKLAAWMVRWLSSPTATPKVLSSIFESY
jgi:hypothetical protein